MGSCHAVTSKFFKSLHRDYDKNYKGRVLTSYHNQGGDSTLEFLYITYAVRLVWYESFVKLVLELFKISPQVIVKFALDSRANSYRKLTFRMLDKGGLHSPPRFAHNLCDISKLCHELHVFQAAVKRFYRVALYIFNVYLQIYCLTLQMIHLKWMIKNNPKFAINDSLNLKSFSRELFGYRRDIRESFKWIILLIILLWIP